MCTTSTTAKVPWTATPLPDAGRGAPRAVASGRDRCRSEGARPCGCRAHPDELARQGCTRQDRRQSKGPRARARRCAALSPFSCVRNRFRAAEILRVPGTLPEPASRRTATGGGESSPEKRIRPSDQSPCGRVGGSATSFLVRLCWAGARWLLSSGAFLHRGFGAPVRGGAVLRCRSLGRKKGFEARTANSPDSASQSLCSSTGAPRARHICHICSRSPPRLSGVRSPLPASGLRDYARAAARRPGRPPFIAVGAPPRRHSACSGGGSSKARLSNTA